MAGQGLTTARIRPPWALGLCDRCGFSYPLNMLKVEFYDSRPDGLLICSDCLDVDQPQLQLGRIKVDDPQSLIDPRPDVGVPGSTGLFGWQPIGNPLNNIQCDVGTILVTVT